MWPAQLQSLLAASARARAHQFRSACANEFRDYAGDTRHPDYQLPSLVGGESAPRSCRARIIADGANQFAFSRAWQRRAGVGRTQAVGSDARAPYRNNPGRIDLDVIVPA